METLAPLTSHSDAQHLPFPRPRPRHRSQDFVAHSNSHLRLSRRGTCSCPSPTPPFSSARGRHLGWQERLRAKKHLERAGWMSGGLAVMSPLNVRRGARNIKCRPYRPALASHNPNRGQRVKAIHNSSARPPRSPQVVQHGGPFKGCGYMSCETKMDFFFFFYDYFFSRGLRRKDCLSQNLEEFSLPQKVVFTRWRNLLPLPFSSWCKTLVKGGAIFLFFFFLFGHEAYFRSTDKVTPVVLVLRQQTILAL